DFFLFGDQFDPLDQVDGGPGNDILILEGDYSSTQLVLGATSLTGVERIVLVDNYPYDIVTDDANVAAGALLTVDGSALGEDPELHFDGSAETDGRFVLIGGGSNDELRGGAMGDILWGRGGANTLDGNGGTDRADYSLANAAVHVDLAASWASDNGMGGVDVLEEIE